MGNKTFYGNNSPLNPKLSKEIIFFWQNYPCSTIFFPGQFCPWMFLKCIWWVHFCSLQKSLIITFVRNSSIHVYNFAWKLKEPKKSYYFSAIFQTCFCLISEVWVNPSQETLLSTKHLTLFPPPLLPPVRSYLGSRVKRDLSFVRLVTKLTSAAQSKLLTIVGRIIRATGAKGPTLCGFYLMLLNPSVE